ncbi:retropepsin-like aspartic protease [Pedobacter sp.]|jgi:predicted aspartyl protease|uniref:retropepsin-like aspartic protease n=1 Tax=Pedobacter sp. TaxID=1411316 RepID=UPI002CEAEF6A|nr:retropepsin-like aspartic protease [Pedobacter sp.]HWW38709.1 retropepsin-like aspartic protease [Pedobacter sp.]
MGSRQYLYLVFLLMLGFGVSYGQTGASGNIPSKLLVKVPFETEHGSVILKVRINNSPKVLRLLFDTGADGMAISQSLADSIGLKITRKQNASVVGGNMEIQVSDGNTVHLDDFEVKNQGIAVFKEMHKDLDGIIGNTIARRYITKVDYDRKELSLYNFGDYQYEKEGASIPFTMPSGLFIIPGSLSITTEPVHTGDFVFDTGASYSLICFRPFVKKNKLLVSGFKAEYNGSTTSMGMTTPTFGGRAATFSFSNMPVIKNMPVTLMAGGGQSESWNPGFDGSIGVRLISRYNFTINMQKKEIHFSPNKTYSYPYDFSIGGFLFGFDLNGDLMIQGLTAVENPKVSLRTGAKVLSINGLSAQVLLKDNKQFNKLMVLPAGTSYVVESVQNGSSFKDSIIKQE